MYMESMRITRAQVAFITGEFSPDDSQKSNVEETLAPHPIEINYGYSRDHRPDLKQFILDLICSGDGDVPLFLRVADGNEADKAVFAQVLVDFKKQLTLDTLMVADSALYSEANREHPTLAKIPFEGNMEEENLAQSHNHDP